MPKHLRAVAREHRFQIAKLKAHAFNFFFAQLTGAPPDCEATFRGAVYKMGGRAQVAREIRISMYCFERRRSSAIAVLADQDVDGWVFAESSYAGSEDDQLRTVGQRHAGAVDRLVAKPCAVKLMRIKINDSLLDGRFEYLEIDFQAELGGTMEALRVVADEKAAHGQSVVCRASDDGEYVDDGQMPQKTIGGVIENIAHGILRTAHDALHPINRAQVMASVYALPASGAHENVLVVVRHADDFLGHDLADREHQIETALRNPPIHLGRPRIVQLAFRLLMDELRRYLAESLNVGSPVMHSEKLYRHGAKHARDLVRWHGSMGAKSRENRLQPVAVILPRVMRQVARAGMYTALIGRYNKHAISSPHLRQTAHKQILQLWKQIAFDTAGGAVETHAANYTFFSPGASRYMTTKANRQALDAMPKRTA